MSTLARGRRDPVAMCVTLLRVHLQPLGGVVDAAGKGEYGRDGSFGGILASCKSFCDS